MGILWEVDFWAFFWITLVISGGAAIATGRAMALKWRPFWQLVVYTCMLGMVDRFLHWGLFLDALHHAQGALLSPYFYMVDTAILLLLSSLAFRITRARQMATQYGWLYERSGLFGWRSRGPAA
ncbi:MAG: hypothetical protein VX871_02395 [Pseudomonadota bacterium]|nr:hypothetical protein [Pseudomonadota bacterium]